jgi:predicted RNA-binding Zn-ribbon protein involved in translation (DUF1610 family)
MSEVQATKKYHCPACGAEATWNPAKQALVCGYCDTVSPATIETSTDGEEQIVEHDLVQALRSFDGARGWEATKTSVRCQSCNAISVFDPTKVAKRCDFCGSASLVPYEEIKESFRPESLLPMKVSETQVRESIRQWYASRWFAPNALGSKAMTDTVHGIYIPYWTFDAQVEADWDAQSGYYYYETETYQDANGRTQTRQVRHTRWVPSSGHVSHFFDDELVCASKGVDRDLLPKMDNFPTKALVPYNSGYLSGWVVERYQIDLVNAAKTARDRMSSETDRFLRVQAQFDNQTFKHILVPVWLLSYTYGTTTYQVLINGYTGDIAGKYPKSFWKIFFLVIALLCVVGLVLFFGNRH